MHAGVAQPAASGDQTGGDAPDPAQRPAGGVQAPFHTLGIIGLGLIGGSLALASRRAWPGIRIVGVDHGAALEAARWLVAFDALADAPESVRGAELVVLAAPVRQNALVLRELAAGLAEDVLVTDVGSTKRAIAEAARRAASTAVLHRGPSARRVRRAAVLSWRGAICSKAGDGC